MWRGKQGKYYWLEENYLEVEDVVEDVFKFHPEFVERKYIVVTAFDCGPLRLTQEEFKNGWLQHNDLALHPSIDSVSDMPYHRCDEWYIFSKAPLLEEFKIFVNDYTFSLRDPQYLITETAPTWDLAGRRYLADVIRESQELFWLQIELKEPETYISANDKLIVATQSLRLYEIMLGLADS